MATKEYAGGAARTYLEVGINASAASFTLHDATNYPTGATGNFWIRLSIGLPTEEKIKCSSRTGNVFTVASGGRGGDGTTAQIHSGGATCLAEHVLTAEDAREANTHVNDGEADPHATKLLNNARHDLTARHTIGTVIPASGSGTDLGDTTAAADNSVARGGHKHGYPAMSTYPVTWLASTAPSIGNGALVGKYAKLGKRCEIYISLTIGSSTTFGAGGWYFSLPSGIVPVNSGTEVGEPLPCFLKSGGLPVPAFAQIAVDSPVAGNYVVVYSTDNAPSSSNFLAFPSGTYPNPWIAGDHIVIAGSFECS